MAFYLTPGYVSLGGVAGKKIHNVYSELAIFLLSQKSHHSRYTALNAGHPLVGHTPSWDRSLLYVSVVEVVQVPFKLNSTTTYREFISNYLAIGQLMLTHTA